MKAASIKARRRWRFILILVAGAVLPLSCLLLALAHRPAISAIDPPPASRFPTAMIARGGGLATIGNCSSCHDGPQGGFLAGSRPIARPFGTLYSANITPDPETGVGHWSLVAFTRAMREGVDRRGRHLYPAFPFDHFSELSDADIAALYAWLMTRTPAVNRPPANRPTPPLGFRPLLAGWKLLFFRPHPFTPAPVDDATWNRGAYLAEALAHCGGYHNVCVICRWGASDLFAARPAPAAVVIPSDVV